MIAALLLAAAGPAAPSVIDAERAFAAAAKAEGQWTAFREYAAPNAAMFAPGPVDAQAWLKGRADPVKPIDWWPTAAWVSCDGGSAVDVGGWRRPDGTVGYFTTVWKRQSDGGWKWIVDSGDALSAPRRRVRAPAIRRAACDPPPVAQPAAPANGAVGLAADRSLGWTWLVTADGTRQLSATTWDGHRWRIVVQDEVAAP